MVRFLQVRFFIHAVFLQVKICRLLHSGTSFFEENVGTVFAPKMREIHSPGGGKRSEAEFVLV